MKTARLSSALCFIALFFLSLSADISAQKDQVRWWRESWSKAQAEAKERNVPILIAVIQDGEEANEGLVDDVFKTKDFAKLTANVVPLICSREDHGLKRVDVDGIIRAVCKRFGYTTCTKHQDFEREMRMHFFKQSGIKTPQVMLCTPGLEMVERLEDIHPPAAFKAAIRKVTKKIGPGLDRAAHRAAKLSLVEARNLLGAQRWSEAWHAVDKLLLEGGKSPLVDKAKAVRRTVDNHINVALKEAYEAADKKDYWTALSALDEVITEFDGTPPAKKAEKAYKRISKNKAARKVASALGKQRRLMPRFDKAQALDRRGEFLEAREAYRKLLKKAKGLPLATRIEKRLDQFEKDEAIAQMIILLEKAEQAMDDFKAAEKLRRAKKTAQARAAYEAIVKKYPATEAAKKATKRLEKLSAELSKPLQLG